MIDNNSSQSSKLPQMPKLSKLPSLHSAKPSGTSMTDLPKLSSPKPLIPALQSSATQLPEVAKEAAPEDNGEATVALEAPSSEDIAKGIAAMKNGPKLQPIGIGLSMPNQPKKPVQEEPEAEATVALEAPSPEEIAKGTAALNAGANKPIQPIGIQAKGPIGFSSPKPLGFGPKPGTAMPAPAPNPPAAAPQADGPVFGGAAAEDSNLQYEDEAPDDGNEKTMMLDAAPDDDLDSIGDEKTQISYSAMEFEPLSGKLIVEAGKTNQREYLLVREKTSLGRAPSNDIAIADIAMSRKHVEIDKFPEGFRIRDLESGNGTILNDRRIRVAQLRDGDIIEIGSIRFKFEQTGGDPDVLWKGDPIIDYHPNQQHKRPAGAQMQHNNGQQQNYQPQPPQQMESMLERQGGGIAAPSWIANPSMTSPYMPYGGNLRSVNAIPPWILITFAAVTVLFISSIVFLIISYASYSSNEKKVQEQREVIAKMNEKLAKSLSSYSDSHYSDAIAALKEVSDLDPDKTIIKDDSFLESYRVLFSKEEDLNNKIKTINDKLRGLSKQSDYPADEYVQDIKVLKEVPENSIHKKWADSIIAKADEAYAERLRNKIENFIEEEKYDEARELLKVLAAFADPKSKVASLANRIYSAEQRKVEPRKSR